MIRNFLTVAIRSLRRQMMYSSINIIGLAVGMACSLVIFLYVYGEWSHDKHFKNGDNIYRIGISFFNLGQFAKAPVLLGRHLPNEYAGIKHFTSFNKKSGELLTVGDQGFKDLVYVVDSSFFNVFSYEFQQGNPATALIEPFSVVLTESMALKYFKDEDALGKTLEVGKTKVPYHVTGIVKDDDRNSHLKAQIWLTMTPEPDEKLYWTSAAVYSYAMLEEGQTQEDLKEAIDALIANQVFPTAGKMMGKTSVEEYIQDDNSVKFFIHPLKDIYLKSNLGMEVSPGGNETNMIVFSIIAIFILVLAAVNFVNLATARATRRAKEVGVRKSLGTTRNRLVWQFLIESVMVSLFSMMLALCLAELFTLAFYWITGQQLSVNIWSGFATLSLVFAFGVLVGVLSGLYPAFYLTAFNPVKVLKGNMASGRQRFRDVLVVFQFAISITLIIATIIIVRQLDYMSSKDLGFEQENTISVDNIDELGQSAVSFREEVLQNPNITNASLHSGEPGSKAIISMYVFQTPEMANALTVTTYMVDHRYLDVMGFRLLAGRNFNPELVSDTAAIILNESAVRAMGIQEKPVGFAINNNQVVIGVVSDFHWESLRNEIAPIAMILTNERKPDMWFSNLGVKVKAGNASGVLSDLEKKWKQRKPDEPFEYHFLDENFGALVEKEQTFGKAIGFFTALAILISCLGLFGLAAYTTEQRTKEIGIRMVLGASAANVVLMLNKKFARLVFLSIIIAVPCSYLAAEEWLSSFAYKTDLNPFIFVGGGILAFVVCGLTVAFHSVRAAQTNPSETLKCE
jgi:putative ABC transport system permease protein